MNIPKFVQILKYAASAEHYRQTKNYMRWFENDCGHNLGSYFGTVHLLDDNGWNDIGDLYFFKNINGNWYYCFRTGPMGDYSSWPMHLTNEPIIHWCFYAWLGLAKLDHKQVQQFLVPHAWTFKEDFDEARIFN